MSEIENGGLDQYGAEHFEQQQFGTAGVEGVNKTTELKLKTKTTAKQLHVGLLNVLILCIVYLCILCILRSSLWRLYCNKRVCVCTLGTTKIYERVQNVA